MVRTGGLMDVQQFSLAGNDLCLHLSYSELGKNKKNEEKSIISFTTISGVVLLGAFMYGIHRWRANQRGNLKMNTDGSARGDPGDGGFGGLIRDEKGIWICGFYGKLTKCSCIEAEIWAIYRGLTIAFEKGFKDLIIETDSMDAIDMLKEEVQVISPLRSLVEDSKFLIRRCGYTLQHVLREGNLSADGLAKMGADQDEPLVVMEDAPDGIRSQVVADMIGRSSRRQNHPLP